MPDATTISVPREDLLEAIGHVDAIAVLLGHLETEESLFDRAHELVVRLTCLLPDSPDAVESDSEYENHPVNVAIWARSEEIVDALDAEWDLGPLRSEITELRTTVEAARVAASALSGGRV